MDAPLVAQSPEALAQAQKELAETRKDGRKPAQLRPMSTEQGLLNRADGSARFTQGNTSVIAAVYGPMDVRPRKEILDRATVEVIYKPKTGQPGAAEREAEFMLRRALEAVVLTHLHPRTLVRLVIQVMQDDGSLYACGINAASLALMDAGVPMGSTMAACTCAISAEGRLLMDPTRAEEQAAAALLNFAFDRSCEGPPAEAAVLASRTRGALTPETYFACLRAAASGAARTLAFVRLSAEKKLRAEFAALYEGDAQEEAKEAMDASPG